MINQGRPICQPHLASVNRGPIAFRKPAESSTTLVIVGASGNKYLTARDCRDAAPGLDGSAVCEIPCQIKHITGRAFVDMRHGSKIGEGIAPVCFDGIGRGTVGQPHPHTPHFPRLPPSHAISRSEVLLPTSAQSREEPLEAGVSRSRSCGWVVGGLPEFASTPVAPVHPPPGAILD